MDPVSLALLLGGTALGGTGAFIGKTDAFNNAQATAEARNRVLEDNIRRQEEYARQNRGIFDENMLHYAPPAQTQRLEDAQVGRTSTNVSNIPGVATGIPLTPTAPDATKSELAKRLAAAHDFAVDRAKKTGALGGFGDSWFENQLGNTETSRGIGVNNLYSAGRKSLLDPEQDLAATAAYKPPSIWGPLLQGAGNIMGAAGGAGLGKKPQGSAVFDGSNYPFSQGGF